MWAEDRQADQDTLRRIAAGEQNALAELYDRHARSIYSLALRILQDSADAEDVVQDVFSQAWRHASRYDTTRGVVGAWLLTIARSRAIDRLRAKRARPDHVADERVTLEIAGADVSAERALISAEQITRVRHALDALPAVQRAAVDLAYYQGMTHAEIAERLDQPLGTVKTRIRQALLKLRDALAGVE
jgi:RNA polymerase sigma-70 factor (ECF subfamily)